MNSLLKGRFKRVAAVLLAVSMGVSPVAAAEDITAQINTAIILAETDLNTNSSAIKILLEQCAEQLGETDPIYAVLKNVIVLLDTGNADSASVTVLLQSAANLAGAANTAADDAGTDNTDTGDQPDPAVQEESVQQDMQSETDPLQTESVPVQSEGDSVQTESTPVQSEGDSVQTEGSTGGSGTDASQSESAEETERKEYVSEYGLPVYQVTAFIREMFDDSIIVDVPGEWGNNASGRALTSYSPVNDSGAISPSAGTLTISFFPMESASAEDAFNLYEKSIADMSVTTALSSEDATAAELPARRIDYSMSVGANQFHCETVCFAFEEMMYAIELMQGQHTAYDYFPAYYQVVDSAEAGSVEELTRLLEQMTEAPVQSETQPVTEAPAQSETQQITEAPAQSETQPVTEVPAQSETQPVTEVPAQSETQPVTEVPAQSETQPVTEAVPGVQVSADIGSFQYEINGHIYQFPTPVRDMAETDLQLNRQLTLPYDFRSDADMQSGSWTEIVNTQYYHFQNSLYKEMIGVTNMSGYPIVLSEGVITALIDTQGTDVRIALPGGITVGSAERDILVGFPEFAQISMDGVAAFRGNELLYACNVRDDGCNGYVLIRNDAPYYSAVSIICENGIIKEISFECLGSVRANGVFL